MVKLLVELEEAPEELVWLAQRHGFLRENPRKRWTDPERKEAVRFYLQRLVKEDRAKIAESNKM